MAGSEAAVASKPRCQAYKVGAITVTTVADGMRVTPMDQEYIINASRDQINAALKEAGLPADKVTNHFNPIVIETAGKRVLIDTGNGEAAGAASNGAVGNLLGNLRAGGLAPESIDIVIISHFHGDHVRGLLTAQGQPAFPQAELKVPAGEWAFWMSDEEMAKAEVGRMDELFALNRKVFAPFQGKVTLYDDGEEVVPGVEAVLTPGHSIGHMSFLVQSGKERLFVQSDVTNNPALFVRNPGWQGRFDQFPDQTIATRRKVYDMLVAEKIPVQGFHYPFPGRGLVEADGARYKVTFID